MAGNKKSGDTLRNTMIEKHGSEEAWKDYMRSIASKGGSRQFPGKGFANPNSDPRAAGALGGKIGKRGKQHDKPNKV